MSGDRTQHAIDAIDGCLDDWSVSGDAMRWSPEPPLADWEKALVADPFDPSDPILTLPAHIQPRYSTLWSALPGTPLPITQLRP